MHFEPMFAMGYPDGLILVTVVGGSVKFSFGLKYLEPYGRVAFLICINKLDSLHNLRLSCDKVFNIYTVTSGLFDKNFGDIEKVVFFENNDIELIFYAWKNGGLIDLICKMFPNLSVSYYRTDSDYYVERFIDIAL